ncbi:MAG: hypothetical protein F4X19_09105 [Acidobacteria bacterium]|nr:hypothetical protein [Acidobacteriota bacterium]
MLACLTAILTASPFVCNPEHPEQSRAIPSGPEQSERLAKAPLSITMPETTASAWWLETGSMSCRAKWLIHMDAQDAQDFFLEIAGLQS